MYGPELLSSQLSSPCEHNSFDIPLEGPSEKAIVSTGGTWWEGQCQDEDGILPSIVEMQEFVADGIQDPWDL